MIPEQHRERLDGCQPQLIELAGKLINRMEELHLGMMVAHDGGLRSLADQQRLYAIGRTTQKWRAPVTKADGIRSKSIHQSGLAVDIIWRGKTPYKGPWDIYHREAKKLGFKLGPKWDPAHVQLV